MATTQPSQDTRQKPLHAPDPWAHTTHHQINVHTFEHHHAHLSRKQKRCVTSLSRRLAWSSAAVPWAPLKSRRSPLLVQIQVQEQSKQRCLWPQKMSVWIKKSTEDPPLTHRLISASPFPPLMLHKTVQQSTTEKRHNSSLKRISSDKPWLVVEVQMFLSWRLFIHCNNCLLKSPPEVRGMALAAARLTRLVRFVTDVSQAQSCEVSAHSSCAPNAHLTL